MNISDIFDISPEAALEAYFRQENDRRRFYKDSSIFILYGYLLQMNMGFPMDHSPTYLKNN